jgi:hypothetical protein
MHRRTLLALAAAHRTSSAAQLPSSSIATRFLGVTVMPEYIQSETVDGVLTNLIRRARATAVTTSPYVMQPAADPQSGSREPPIDGGAGKVRLLDRPLWGKRELMVETAPSFEHNLDLFKGLRYQPSPPTSLTRSHGGLLRDFLTAAKARGLRTYLQVQAAIPPGYRVQFGGPVEEDRPRLPGGKIPSKRLANNGSLASVEIRKYTAALLRDIFRVYPDIDGVRLDWPEYPPYYLDDCFLDFNPRVRAAASRLGFDFSAMENAAARLYGDLHGGLTNDALRAWLASDGGRSVLTSFSLDRPGILELIRFKAALSEDYLREMRAVVPRGKELIAHAFPAPFCFASGLDAARASTVCDGVAVKLYTMHWPMMLSFYASQLVTANPQADESLIVRAVARWMDIADDAGRFRSLADCRYPEPDEPHPHGPAAQANKIAFARRGSSKIFALAHGYGPLDDYRQRLATAWKASGGRVWINRYGYLSNAKLDATGETTL